MIDKPSTDSAEHAQQFARTWAEKLEEHCTIRMQELGIPENMNGQPDYGGGWKVAGVRLEDRGRRQKYDRDHS